MVITDTSLIDINKKYTYADYLCWQVKDRLELIKGRLFKMSPAPTSYHQKLSSRLHIEIGNYLKRKNCEIFHAPFDVRLPKNNNEKADQLIYTVVQPDICVICDLSKIDTRGCLGAPDLIIEILSSKTAPKDLNEKFHLYEECGVFEYWIVYPGENILEVFVANQEQKYILSGKYTRQDIVESSVIAGLKVELKDIFDEIYMV